MGSIYVAVPTLAAAVGFYFLDRNHVKVWNGYIYISELGP